MEKVQAKSKIGEQVHSVGDNQLILELIQKVKGESFSFPLLMKKKFSHTNNQQSKKEEEEKTP